MLTTVTVPNSDMTVMTVYIDRQRLEQAYNENLVLNDSLLERIEKVGNAEDAIADYVRIKMYDPIYVPLVDQVYNRDLT